MNYRRLTPTSLNCILNCSLSEEVSALGALAAQAMLSIYPDVHRDSFTLAI